MTGLDQGIMHSLFLSRRDFVHARTSKCSGAMPVQLAVKMALHRVSLLLNLAMNRPPLSSVSRQPTAAPITINPFCQAALLLR